LPDNHAEYKKIIHDAKVKLQQTGRSIVIIEVRFDEFIIWAKNNNRNDDGSARAGYAALRLDG